MGYSLNNNNCLKSYFQTLYPNGVNGKREWNAAHKTTNRIQY